jgi:outer membrane protein assembly factor BamD
MQPHSYMHRTFRLLFIAVALAALGLSGCKSFGWGKDDKAKGSPESIYGQARKDLRSGNYQGAIQKYENLEARFPFSEQAKQGQLDLLYAYYKNHALESAIDQADQFIRENPAHPRVDYAWYVKGLVYFESGANWLERVFRADITKRPPQEAKKSMQAFQTLLQQYPKSPYGPDARQRIVYLRNRLADYELSVARYYMKRGAYVGAAARARGIVEQYDGAPAVGEALEIMAEAYRRLGINDLAEATDKVRKANPAPVGADTSKGFFAGLTTSDAAAAGQGDGTQFASRGGQRAGHWDVAGGIATNQSASIEFQGGTKADIASSTGFLFGVGYNLNDRLELGGQFGYDRKDYTAKVAGDQPGEVFPIKGTLDSMSLMFNATYNVLTGPLTPFVSGGLGWSWVDTNIATEPPTVGCWWDPWYGYVCTGFQKTKTIDGLAYQLGVGVRWDFQRAFFARGSYNMNWVDLGKSKGTPEFGGFQLLLGWKF